MYYGWRVARALALTETVSWGVLYYAFAVILLPMQEEMGWSRTEVTGAFSLALLVSGISAPFMGRWLDRHGPRALMTLGSVAGVGFVLAWSSVESLWAFYLTWVGMGLAMAATLYEPAFAVVARWFVRRRERALLLVTFAGGFASTIFLPLTGWMVDAQGWRWALVVLAVLLAVLTVPPHALVLRRGPEEVGLAPDGAAGSRAPAGTRSERESATLGVALRGASFWLLSASFFLVTLSQVAIGVHLIPYLGEQGYGLGLAATLTGSVGASQVLGRVVMTLLGERLPMDVFTAGVFGLQAVGLIALIGWEGLSALIFFVVLFGAASGAATLARASLVADFYGPAHYGSIGGVVAMFAMGARTLAPVGAGALYALAGGYGPVLWTLVAGSSLAAVCMYLAQRVVRGERLEREARRT